MNSPADNSYMKKIDLAFFLQWARRHWRFIIWSTVICSAAGIAYLYYTPKSWTRTSQITMKFSAHGIPTTSDLLIFSDIGILNQSISFDNEKHLVNSYVVWDEIVDDLKLNYEYSEINALWRKTPLYRDNPVEVILPDDIENSEIDYLSFRIKKKGNGLALYDFSINEKSVDTDDITIAPGQTAGTPAGKITVTATAYFSEWENGAIEFLYTAKPVYIPKMQTAVSQGNTDRYATIIETTYSDYSPDRANDILNYIPIAYTTVWNRHKNEVAAMSKETATQMLDTITKKLRDTESRLQQLMESKKMTAPMIDAAKHYNEKALYGTAAVDASIAYEVTGFILDKLKTEENGKFGMIPVDSSIDSMAIRRQIAGYNERVLEYAALSGDYGNKNSEILSREKELERMKANIITSLSQYRQQTGIKLDAIERRYDEIQSEAAGLSESEKEWRALQRRLMSEEAVMMYLIGKNEENDIAAGLNVQPVRTVMSAYGDDEPDSPNTKSVMLVALFLGLVGIPFIAALSSNSLDYNITDISDFRFFSFSVIGQIPQMGRITLRERFNNLLHTEAKAEKTPKLLVNKESIFTESIRVFRYNFDKVTAPSKDTPVTLLTSFTPNSGKTFFLFNLAVSIAAGGKKVLLIDADIRRASMSEYVGKPRTGLTSYLHGATDMQKIVLKDRIAQGLDIIPAGEIPTDPTELLQNGRLGELIGELKPHYDYIFLDAPPINMIADTHEIAQTATHTLFVIRSGMLDRRMLPELERIYREHIYPGLYVVFNGSTAEQFKSRAVKKSFNRKKKHR